MKVDKEINQILIHSGQHYDYEMSQVFFKELKLPKPDYFLECKGHQIGKMIDKLRVILREIKPKLVLVYGDCNTTLAGALAAAYENIPLAHVEAGLRCGRMDMPEEVNRVLTDRLATYKLCPNEEAVQNLQWEGIRQNVFVTGDPLFDAMNPFCPIPVKNKNKYILLTIHRQENMNPDRLRVILNTLAEVKEKFIFPIHPRTREVISRNKIPIGKNIKLIKPVGYKKMLTLEANAKHIVTDSGGVTREAYWLGVPVSSLRRETEWNETVETGWNFLVDADPERIKNSLISFSRKLTKGSPIIKFGAKKAIREILSTYV